MTTIYVTGEPGTGKSTIGKLLGSYYKLPIVEISKLVITEGLHIGYDEKRQCHIIDEEKVIHRLHQILETSSVILIGPIIPINPDFIHAVIVLSANPPIIRQRLSLRDYTQAKIKENIEALLYGVALGEAMDNFPNTLLIEMNTNDPDPETNIQLITEKIGQINTNKARTIVFTGLSVLPFGVVALHLSE